MPSRVRVESVPAGLVTGRRARGPFSPVVTVNVSVDPLLAIGRNADELRASGHVSICFSGGLVSASASNGSCRVIPSRTALTSGCTVRLKAQTTRPPEKTLKEQQERFDRFRNEFNTERPHESLGQKRPATI